MGGGGVLRSQDPNLKQGDLPRSQIQTWRDLKIPIFGKHVEIIKSHILKTATISHIMGFYDLNMFEIGILHFEAEAFCAPLAVRKVSDTIRCYGIMALYMA